MAFEDKAEELLGLLGPRTIQNITAAEIQAGWQNTNQYPVEISIPASTAGSVEIQVSPDGVTYTTLEAARAIAATGSPNIDLYLAPGMWAKVIPTTSVLGQGVAF